MVARKLYSPSACAAHPWKERVKTAVPLTDPSALKKQICLDFGWPPSDFHSLWSLHSIHTMFVVTQSSTFEKIMQPTCKICSLILAGTAEKVNCFALYLMNAEAETMKMGICSWHPI